MKIWCHTDRRFLVTDTSLSASTDIFSLSHRLRRSRIDTCDRNWNVLWGTDNLIMWGFWKPVPDKFWWRISKLHNSIRALLKTKNNSSIARLHLLPVSRIAKMYSNDINRGQIFNLKFWDEVLEWEDSKHVSDKTSKSFGRCFQAISVSFWSNFWPPEVFLKTWKWKVSKRAKVDAFQIRGKRF